jgi:excisionase family DNA binding protein
MPRPRADADSILMTTVQAAARLGVTEGRIRQAILAGELKTAGKVGDGVGNHAIRPRDLEDYRRYASQRDNNGAKLPKGWLSPAEVAARLGVTPARVRQLIAEGKLKAKQHGRRLGITEAGLARYQGKPTGD